MSNARYYKLMGRPEAALKEMEAAHRADPDNLKLVDLLAQYYQELGQFQRAQDLYREALTRRGSHPGLENNFCFSYYLQGNLGKAEACFKEALERDPGNIAARNNLALVWCRQGKLAEAQKLWEQAEGAAGAQNRMNQALALLGKAPAEYAKLPEPKPQPQAAIPPKPAAPVSAAAAKPTAVPAPTAAPVAAPPAKAEPKLAAKVAETKPVSQPQPAVTHKTPTPVSVAVAAKPAPAPAPTAVKASVSTPAKTPAPAPVVAAPPKAAAQPAETNPVPQPPAAALKPAAPVNVAAAVKPAPAPAPNPVKTPPPAPAAAAPIKAEPKIAAQPAVPPPLLAAQERKQSALDVRNGTRTKNLAHDTRSLLTREGFKVALIGNHIDFGVESTVIYYRPGAETVAKVLTAEIFPGARIEPSSSLRNGVAAKVLLGRDLSDRPQTMARLSGEEPAVSQPAAPVTPPQPLAAKKPAAPAKPEALKPPIQANAPAPTVTAPPAVKSAPLAPVLTATSKGHLTAEDLMTNAIEVRNGTRTRDLARQTRSMLSLEGFNVGLIGNHIDFGAEFTVIYYRPEAEKVARALNSKIFPGARLTPDSRINRGMAIKIVLGRDLLDRPRLMSRLTTQ